LVAATASGFFDLSRGTSNNIYCSGVGRTCRYPYMYIYFFSPLRLTTRPYRRIVFIISPLYNYSQPITSSPSSPSSRGKEKTKFSRVKSNDYVLTTIKTTWYFASERSRHYPRTHTHTHISCRVILESGYIILEHTTAGNRRARVRARFYNNYYRRAVSRRNLLSNT